MNFNFFISCILFMTFCTYYGNGDRKYTDKELSVWDPPEEFKRNFPCYLAGEDYDGQPVFVLEFGKWRLRKVIEYGTKESIIQLDKYAEYIGYHWLRTAREFQNDTNGRYGLLVDMEGYDLRQFTHIPTVTFILQSFALRFEQEYAEAMDWLIGINVSYIAQKLADMTRPILGATFAKIEIEGTNKNMWVPKLRRKMSKQFLPEWYGGSENFKPLALYG